MILIEFNYLSLIRIILNLHTIERNYEFNFIKKANSHYRTIKSRIRNRIHIVFRAEGMLIVKQGVQSQKNF
ncbi:hypothetical protein RCL_jg24554.t1 [Rhizophagus clarus]|uniref:Uncharacterized protein n=1 Tax=Rhizophagus clarus TaxID=94130 RepID=A0A8H3R4Y2_9GLOM|nr:hypothetical protein RCL_jg24554.t1 [Rhizophagus clarus]